MQTLKIVIPGNYWDTQIYAGRLYLFGRNADILTLNWDRLIGDFEIGEGLNIAMQCAFRQSNYLYGDRWSLLFSDIDIRKLISSKFDELTRRVPEGILFQEKFLEQAILGHQDNPFPFPHADSTIYLKRMYIACNSGVYSANCDGKKTKHPISTRNTKKWDCSVVSISASYNSLALAACEDGLYEMPIFTRNWNEKPLSTKHCNSCDWSYASIYGSSHLCGGVIACVSRDLERQWNKWGSAATYTRNFKGLIDEEDIFGVNSYSWGSRDKINQLRNKEICVMQYFPWFEDDKQLTLVGHLKLPNVEEYGEMVSAGIALFGTIIEWSNGITVICSNGESVYIPEAPISWRVFTRSKHYENHLHVVYRNRIEIFSFNQDYFVNQDQKLSGIRHPKTKDEDAWIDN